MTYAMIYIAGMFLLPSLVVGAYSVALDRVPLTTRGINVATAGLFTAMALLVVLFAFVLPTPYPGT